jgi:hypothetical protein
MRKYIYIAAYYADSVDEKDKKLSFKCIPIEAQDISYAYAMGASLREVKLLPHISDHVIPLKDNGCDIREEERPIPPPEPAPTSKKKKYVRRMRAVIRPAVELHPANGLSVAETVIHILEEAHK